MQSIGTPALWIGFTVFVLAMLALEFLEVRFPWRGVVLNWLSASGIIAAYLVLALTIANAGGGAAPIIILIPQILFSILAYPIAARLVGAADRFRLTPIITV